MNKYLVVLKPVHNDNTNDNTDAAAQHVLTHVEANTFGEAELKVNTIWAKVNCQANIVQITLYS